MSGKENIRNKKHYILLALVIVLGVILAGCFVVMNARMFAQEDGTKHANKTDFNTHTLDDLEDETVNFLLIGVDEGSINTDVIILVNLDTINDKITVLQIPRDLYIGDDVATGKINAAYGHPEDGQSNIASLISKINEKFKLTIDHYATITFEGFTEAIDILGGVEIDVQNRIAYGNGDALVLEPGKQVLDGEKSLAYIRHRKSYIEGDIGRVKAQTLFLESLVEMVYDVSVTEAAQIVGKCFNKITTDLSINEIMNYYFAVKKIDRSAISFFILEGTSVTEAYNGHSIYAIDKEAAADLFNNYFRPNSPAVSADDLPLTDRSELSDYFYGVVNPNIESTYDQAEEDEDTHDDDEIDVDIYYKREVIDEDKSTKSTDEKAEDKDENVKEEKEDKTTQTPKQEQNDKIDESSVIKP